MKKIKTMVVPSKVIKSLAFAMLIFLPFFGFSQTRPVAQQPPKQEHYMTVLIWHTFLSFWDRVIYHTTAITNSVIVLKIK